MLDKLKFPKTISEYYRDKPDLLTKVYDYIKVCESDQDSYYHYNYLKSLYNKINSMPEQLSLELKSVLSEFFRKHRQYESEGYTELDPEDY